MKRLFILAVVCAHFFAGAFVSLGAEEGALDPAQTFTKANMYYGKGEYKEAIKENEVILAEGFKSGNLYYNLGNAYFKSGDLGRAVLNYERARRMIPRDSDLLSNYHYAKSIVKQKDPPEKRILPLKWLDRGMDYVTLKEGMILATVLFYVLVIYIILTRIFGKFKNFSLFGVVLLTVLLITLMLPLTHKLKDFEEGAVVVAKIADARFEPAKDAMVHFPVYEGMKAYIIRRKGDWYKISRPDGKLGWVKRSEVSLVSI